MGIEEVQMLLCNLIPQVSIISYNGEFACNMVLDAAQFAHPEALREAWDAELAALHELLAPSPSSSGYLPEAETPPYLRSASP